MKVPPIPKGINFGLGHRVPVVRREQIRGLDGKYDPNTIQIELNDSTSPLWERYLVYAHEVLHAAVDFNLRVLRDIVIPMVIEAQETVQHLRETKE